MYFQVCEAVVMVALVVVVVVAVVVNRVFYRGRKCGRSLAVEFVLTAVDVVVR